MGFKKTSETIAISFDLDESAANTFTEEEIALQLDVLNNEIFVVLAVDLNLNPPEMIGGANSSVAGAVSSTSRTTLGSLAQTNTIAVAQEAIRSDALGSQVSFQRNATESYTGDVDYIALISTNNFYVQIAGQGNTAGKTLTGRLWGFRARADAATYAALVNSEVLSA